MPVKQSIKPRHLCKHCNTNQVVGGPTSAFCSDQCRDAASFIVRKCKVCDADFKVRHNHAAMGFGIYCSKKCLFNRSGETLEDRYLKHVVKNDSGCWGWSGAKGHCGHAHFYWNGKNIVASRASWIIHRGDIPDGMFVCHKCDNPPCTNPDHLFIGTPKDNTQDMIAKGRAVRVYGIPSPRAKITGDDAIEIRRRRACGESKKSLAREYGLHPKTITELLDGKTWKAYLPKSVPAIP